jgi:hypothetical protein
VSVFVSECVRVSVCVCVCAGQIFLSRFLVTVLVTVQLDCTRSNVLGCVYSHRINAAVLYNYTVALCVCVC